MPSLSSDTVSTIWSILCPTMDAMCSLCSATPENILMPAVFNMACWPTVVTPACLTPARADEYVPSSRVESVCDLSCRAQPGTSGVFMTQKSCGSPSKIPSLEMACASVMGSLDVPIGAKANLKRIWWKADISCVRFLIVSLLGVSMPCAKFFGSPPVSAISMPHPAKAWTKGTKPQVLRSIQMGVAALEPGEP